MERRFLDGERAQKMRRAIATDQLVSQSEEPFVGYWLERYADGAVRESGAAAPRKGRKSEPDAPEAVAAAR
jgi:hypothetical protein